MDGWDCESCKASLGRCKDLRGPRSSLTCLQCDHQPQRPRYAARELRQTRDRNVSVRGRTTARPLPRWRQHCASWSLYEDDSKVVKYHAESLFGEGSELMLRCTPMGQHAPSSHAARALVSERIAGPAATAGPAELNSAATSSKPDPIRRKFSLGHEISPSDMPSSGGESTSRPSTTLLYGPESAPDIECFPTGAPVPWRHAPSLAIDIVDYMNDRAGRMFPGESE